MKGTGVDVRRGIANATNSSPNRSDNSADVLQLLHMKINFVTPCARILMARKNYRDTERKLESAWRNSACSQTESVNDDGQTL